jgi:hypothetical protein
MICQVFYCSIYPTEHNILILIEEVGDFILKFSFRKLYRVPQQAKLSMKLTKNQMSIILIVGR